MHRDAMDAMADLCVWIRHVLRMQPVIDRFPRFSTVIGTERTCGRDRHEHSSSILRIEENCMQTHSTRARLPFRAGVVFSKTGQFVPRFAAVPRFEERGVFHAGVNMLGIMQ